MKFLYPKSTENLLWIVFMVVFSAQLTSIFWGVVGHSPEKRALKLSEATHTGPDRPEQAGTAVIRGLFGHVQTTETPKPENVAPREAPATRLQLTLKGVFTATDPALAGAIIEDPRKQAAYYRVGETVPGNAKLVEVYSDQVILERRGQREVLRFRERTSNPRQNPTTASRLTRRPAPASVESTQDFMNEAERRLAQNPVAALNTVGLSAVKPGQPQGYVFDGRNPMLTRLNLKKGDIIRSVNGIPIGDVQKDRKLLRTLYQQGHLSVEVERDGTFFTVNYTLER